VRLGEVLGDFPELTEEDQFRRRLLRRIESQGLRTTGEVRTLLSNLLFLLGGVLLFGVLPYFGARYYRYITGHDQFVAQVSLEAETKAEVAGRLRRSHWASFRYREQSLPAWASHYYFLVQGMTPEQFMAALFNQAQDGEMGIELIRPFFEQSNVFDDAYVRYDLSAPSLTGPHQSPVVVFGRQIPRRFTLKYPTRVLRQLYPYLSALSPAGQPDMLESGPTLTLQRLRGEKAIEVFVTFVISE